MRITAIEMKPAKRCSGEFRHTPRGETLAFANVEFDRCFRVRGIRIREDSRGYYAAYPEIVADGKNIGEWFHPTDPEFRSAVERELLAAYAERVGVK